MIHPCSNFDVPGSSEIKYGVAHETVLYADLAEFIPMDHWVENRHFDEIFVTGCPGNCHLDNIRWRHLIKFSQNDHNCVSVIIITRALPAYVLNMAIAFLHGEHYSDVINNAMVPLKTDVSICLLNRLFGRRAKKTPKLRVTGVFDGIHRWPVDSPHKWPAAREMLSFDDVIMGESRSIFSTVLTIDAT